MNRAEIESRIETIKNHEMSEYSLAKLLTELENPKTSRGKQSLQDYIMNADIDTLSHDVVTLLEELLEE